MQDQDFDLDRQGMTVRNSLAASRGHADRQVAGDSACGLAARRKREHIRRLVFTAKFAIEPTDLRIGGQQDTHLTLQSDQTLSLAQKARQSAHRR